MLVRTAMAYSLSAKMEIVIEHLQGQHEQKSGPELQNPNENRFQIC